MRDVDAYRITRTIYERDTKSVTTQYATTLDEAYKCVAHLVDDYVHNWLNHTWKTFVGDYPITERMEHLKEDLSKQILYANYGQVYQIANMLWRNLFEITPLFAYNTSNETRPLREITKELGELHNNQQSTENQHD